MLKVTWREPDDALDGLEGAAKGHSRWSGRTWRTLSVAPQELRTFLVMSEEFDGALGLCTN